MQEPIETVIICTQQNSEIMGGLKTLFKQKSKIRVGYILKKDKNVLYKLTLLGILFQASIKNKTEQVFLTGRELNDVKKTLTNSKISGLLGIFDFKKINNWEDIKGQSIWINATLEEQKEQQASLFSLLQKNIK